MRPTEMAALYASDLKHIERILMTKKIGSGDAAALIEAAGELSMDGVSVDVMIRRLHATERDWLKPLSGTGE